MYKTSSIGRTPLGIVVGTARTEVPSLKTIGMKVKGSFGKTAGIVLKKKEQLLEEAIENLQNKVKLTYPTATAIYDVDYHFNTSEYFFDLAITGTPVSDSAAAAPAAAANAAAAATRRARQRRNRSRRS
jgi:hypothetical protein